MKLVVFVVVCLFVCMLVCSFVCLSYLYSVNAMDSCRINTVTYVFNGLTLAINRRLPNCSVQTMSRKCLVVQCIVYVVIFISWKAMVKDFVLILCSCNRHICISSVGRPSTVYPCKTKRDAKFISKIIHATRRMENQMVNSPRRYRKVFKIRISYNSRPL